MSRSAFLVFCGELALLLLLKDAVLPSRGDFGRPGIGVLELGGKSSATGLVMFGGYIALTEGDLGVTGLIGL